MAANAQGADRGKRGSEATISPTPTAWHQRTRHLYRILAATFTAGLVLQLFIVGIALFVDGARWDLHQRLGHALTLLPVAMLVLTLVGRMSTRTRLLTIVTIALIGLQVISGMLGGWAGALHPVNALLMIGIGVHLYGRTSIERN